MVLIRFLSPGRVWIAHFAAGCSTLLTAAAGQQKCTNQLFTRTVNFELMGWVMKGSRGPDGIGQGSCDCGRCIQSKESPILSDKRRTDHSATPLRRLPLPTCFGSFLAHPQQPTNMVAPPVFCLLVLASVFSAVSGCAYIYGTIEEASVSLQGLPCHCSIGHRLLLTLRPCVCIAHSLLPKAAAGGHYTYRCVC
jgi:hypothetical protein